jgi:hypothetical protein
MAELCDTRARESSPLQVSFDFRHSGLSSARVSRLVSASRRNSLSGKPVIARRDHQHAGRARYPAARAHGPNCHCAARAFGNTLGNASLHYC